VSATRAKNRSCQATFSTISARRSPTCAFSWDRSHGPKLETDSLETAIGRVAHLYAVIPVRRGFAAASPGCGCNRRSRLSKRSRVQSSQRSPVRGRSQPNARHFPREEPARSNKRLFQKELSNFAPPLP
jgi:hypothetical protein